MIYTGIAVIVFITFFLGLGIIAADDMDSDAFLFAFLLGMVTSLLWFIVFPVTALALVAWGLLVIGRGIRRIWERITYS